MADYFDPDFTQDFLSSRRNYADGNTRIGDYGRLWYDSITNTIRISDGITPGGIIVGGVTINNWIQVTNTYTANPGDNILADTSGGPFTIYLPGSPAVGTMVSVLGTGLDTNNLTIDGNGSTIEGSLTDLILSTPGVITDFIYDGSTWQAITSGGGGGGGSGYSGYSGYSGLGLSPWTRITSNYYSQTNNRLIADTEAGSFTIYLPASPVTGEYVQITDGWDFALINAFVDPNGSTIENLPDVVALDLKGVTFEFIYDGTTWEVTGTTGARGQSGYSGIDGQGLDPWTKITSNYYAQNENRLIADTQAGSFTITLPATPVTGDYIQITDGWDLGINNAFVDPNGGTIENLPDIVALDLKGVTYEFIYDGTTWEVTGTTGARGQSGYSGQGIQITGVVPDYTYLPTYAPGGTMYIVQNSGGGFNAGDVALSDGGSPISTWINYGPIQGQAGASGYSGQPGQGIQVAGVVTDYTYLPTYAPAGTVYFVLNSGGGFTAGDGAISDGSSPISNWYSTGALQGVSGYSGYSGLPGDSSLIWTTSGNNRILTGFVDTGGAQSTVRQASFQNNLLYLTLATFTPGLTSTVQPGSSLSWDVAATSFGVNVTNPIDFTTQYISSVASLTTISGSITSLSLFTAGIKTPTPAGGVSWTQSFTTDIDSYIRSNSTTIAGGGASATVSYNYWNGTMETLYTGSTSTISVSWLTPMLGVSVGALTGQTFLGSYATVSYTVTVTGMSNPANYSNSVTAVGGNVSNPAGSGTFTFTDAVNKNTIATTRTVSCTTTFVRPVGVTGTSYSAQLTSTSSSPSATFTYPTLWVWTPSTYNIPVRSDYVSGTGFAPGVTVLGNQVKTINTFINNTDAVPKGFWFAVRSSASQPTVFKTGPGPALLSDVAVTMGNSVNLAPDSPPIGYVAEPYTLYGITLQPGSTYMSIS